MLQADFLNLQAQSRDCGKVVFECLPLKEGLGFSLLPEPSRGDIFFDFEGDPYAGDNVLEYLFGWYDGGVSNNFITPADDNYHDLWAADDLAEKTAFEQFIDLVMKIKELDINMHIYHFGSYEQTALKRLAGKYATREDELDTLLRGKVFVNLHTITRNAVIAGIESYSLKSLEKLHGYLREADLRDVSELKLRYEELLESGCIDEVDPETKKVVRDYNRDDCISTLYLRDWLERLRKERIDRGESIPRPEVGTEEPNEKITSHQERIKPLFDALMHDVPVIKAERSEQEQGRWLLANMLDWYRREAKAFWWNIYRLRDLPENELIEEMDALSGLIYTGRREAEKRSSVDYYSFPVQETKLCEGNKVDGDGGTSFGSIHLLDLENRIVGIKKNSKALDLHPTYLICADRPPDSEKENALIRLAEWVIENGLNVDGEYRAARDLLLRITLRSVSGAQAGNQHASSQAAFVNNLDRGVLPIQGPPGTGKSHLAAEMILKLTGAGKKVGITALSHKVIVGLLNKVKDFAAKSGRVVRIVQKVKGENDVSDPTWLKLTKNEIANNFTGDYDIAAGTSFMWARSEFFETADYLFIDEAGQLSLIDTIAVAQAAKNIVLLGDPQQLTQPQQGSHPQGTEVSALAHILQEQKTISADQGLFLDKTWRMHPAINSYVSELFYDNKLVAKEGNEQQRLTGKTKYATPGIYFEPVIHSGNQNSAPEEVEKIREIVDELLNSGSSFVDRDGNKNTFGAKDIKIIAPYNLQVNLLQSTFEDRIQVGTVDKFQGQEAPVMIYSMTSSSQEDAPRGMDFLYSLNRLNVAVSRAKSVFILVASPALMEPDCRSPHQMQLANALCRLKEVAVESRIK